MCTDKMWKFLHQFLLECERNETLCLFSLGPYRFYQVFPTIRYFSRLYWFGSLTNNPELKKSLCSLTALHLISLLLMCLYDKTGFFFVTKQYKHVLLLKCVRLSTNQTHFLIYFRCEMQSNKFKDLRRKPQNAFQATQICVILSFSFLYVEEINRISFKQISSTDFVTTMA